MDIKVLECKKIEFSKTEASLRSFKKEIAEGIANSVREQGLFNAIVVRPDPNKPDHYLGVQGRHRHHAVGKILKEECIPCNVLDMDDLEAEMATITENLFRNELSQAQRSKSVKRWYQIFAEKHPDSLKKGSAGGKASGRAKAAKAAAALGGESEDTTASVADEQTGESEASAESTTFTKQLAAATGVSDRTARREQKLAESLTEDQLEVCEQMGITKTQMEALAGIKDETQKGEVFNLLATGMPYDQAWDEVKPDARKITNHLSKDAETSRAAAGNGEMTDDFWFDTFCGEKAAMLADPESFKIDAVLYREIAEARGTFRGKVKKALAKARAARKGKRAIPFYNTVNRVSCISHPKDWLLCRTCGGKGVHPETGDQCNGLCGGSGYVPKVEEYL